ncbi:hypothetical protein EVAR_27018_1 [Eumeta japonica]|uniref:Uncharacterized protein n=1 Tax=Eumeta variegata TaxID=151549 RepID=A0A4C1WD45_EUMVA|nr:hypothetical protein EVAR_27018_1 [Eumeta japonica]
MIIGTERRGAGVTCAAIGGAIGGDKRPPRGVGVCISEVPDTSNADRYEFSLHHYFLLRYPSPASDLALNPAGPAQRTRQEFLYGTDPYARHNGVTRPCVLV